MIASVLAVVGTLLQDSGALVRYHPRVSKLLILVGLGLVVVGLFWNSLSRLPLGRLPGDLVIDRPGLRIWIPITTLLIVSLVLNTILWLLRRL
jgi:Protein of unknown function (DUF2905)